MPTIGDYTVRIATPSEILREYDCPNDEKNSPSFFKTAKYVEVVEGAKFAVLVTIDMSAKSPTGSKGINILNNGRSLHVSSIGIPSFPPNSKLTHVMAGAPSKEDGDDVWRPFQFQPLMTTDEDSEDEGVKSMAERIGILEVLIGDNFLTERILPRWPDLSNDTTKKIPERALKGQPIDVSAGYGAKEKLKVESKRREFAWRSTNAIFKFKYRTKRALQLLDIVSISTPATLESNLAPSNGVSESVPGGTNPDQEETQPQPTQPNTSQSEFTIGSGDMAHPNPGINPIEPTTESEDVTPPEPTLRQDGTVTKLEDSSFNLDGQKLRTIIHGSKRQLDLQDEEDDCVVLNVKKAKESRDTDAQW